MMTMSILQNSMASSLKKGANYICQMLIYLFICIALIEESSLIMTGVVLFSLIYCFFADVEYIFYLIVGMSIYQNSFTINGDNASFLLIVLFLFKILLKENFKFKLTESKIGLCCTITILILEIINDIFTDSMGALLVTIVYLMFFFYVICNTECLKINLLDFIFLYSFAFLSSTIYAFYTYGGVVQYLTLFLEKSYAYRFAVDAAVEMGGAMGVPLYALILLSVSFATLSVKKRITSIQKLGVITVSCYAFFIGLLTISRSFLLGMLVLLFVFLVQKKSPLRFLVQILLIFGFCFLVCLILPEIVEKIFLNFFERIDGDVGGGSHRQEIWNACFEYMFLHPFNLFFGGGGLSYITFGEGNGAFDMAAGAHNLCIDIFMSWGFIGFLAFMLLMIDTFFRIKKKYKVNEIIFYAPLLTFAAFSMTALRTTELTTWAYLLISILSIQSLAKEKKYDT